MEVSEETMAVAKLRDYVDTCGLNDMERAKTICRAFLNKYDPPQKVDLPPLAGNDAESRTVDTRHRFTIADSLGNLKVMEVHNLYTQVNMDDSLVMTLGPEANKRAVADSINYLAREMYNQGFIKVETVRNMASFTTGYRVSVQVCKEFK